MEGRGGKACAVSFLVALLTMLGAGAGEAATVVNGDFESGTLNGWHPQQLTQAGNWFAYKGTAAPIGSKRKPNPADPVQAPPQGLYAAITDEANPDTLILYQDIALEVGSSHHLSLFAYYDSYEPIAVPTPDTLSVDEEALTGADGKLQKNQQYRIDVMEPTAPLDSINPADILRTMLVTKPGDPQKMAPTQLTADLSAFAGQTVRLRIANAVHEEVFNAGVDAVSISAVAPGQSPPSGAKKPGPGAKKQGPGATQQMPNLFSFEKATVNRRNGSAILRVRVLREGLLRAKGTSTLIDAAGAGEAKKPRKAIESVTIPVSTPKTVAIHLRLTPTAHAVLNKKHNLRVQVSVTLMPTGALPEAASVPVVFKLAAGRASRR